MSNNFQKSIGDTFYIIDRLMSRWVTEVSDEFVDLKLKIMQTYSKRDLRERYVMYSEIKVGEIDNSSINWKIMPKIKYPRIALIYIFIVTLSLDFLRTSRSIRPFLIHAAYFQSFKMPQRK